MGSFIQLLTSVRVFVLLIINKLLLRVTTNSFITLDSIVIKGVKVMLTFISWKVNTAGAN